MAPLLGLPLQILILSTPTQHSGEVTSTADGATVIADNVGDNVNLKVSNAPTNGYFLSAQSGNTGGLTWAAASGGGATSYTIDTKTAAYTVVAGDLGKIIFMDGAGNVTLPSPATVGSGFWLIVKIANDSTTSNTLVPSAGTTIAGGAFLPLEVGMSVKIISDGTNWITDTFGPHMFAYQTIGAQSYARATGNKSIAIGDGSRATGSEAMALGNSLASGADSFAAAIANNTSSYGATGAYSVAIGRQAKASGGRSAAIGYLSAAQSTGSTAIGYSANANANYSMAFGNSLTTIIGQIAFNNTASAFGQSGLFILRSETTDATAEALTTDNTNAGSNDQIILLNNSAYAFSGTIVAREQASDGTDSAAWEIKGLIRREGSAGTTVLVNSATTVLDNTPNWGMALSADTTNGGLKIQVTGAASTNIRWVATINTSEVTY